MNYNDNYLQFLNGMYNLIYNVSISGKTLTQVVDKIFVYLIFVIWQQNKLIIKCLVRNDFFNFSVGNWALEDLPLELFSLSVVSVSISFSFSSLIVRIFDRSPEDKHLKKENKASFWGQLKWSGLHSVKLSSQVLNNKMKEISNLGWRREFQFELLSLILYNYHFVFDPLQRIC